MISYFTVCTSPTKFTIQKTKHVATNLLQRKKEEGQGLGTRLIYLNIKYNPIVKRDRVNDNGKVFGNCHAFTRGES